VLILPIIAGAGLLVLLGLVSLGCCRRRPRRASTKALLLRHPLPSRRGLAARAALPPARRAPDLTPGRALPGRGWNPDRQPLLRPWRRQAVRAPPPAHPFA
jgi:hypothetical protein